MAENPITPEVLRLSNEAVDAEILKAITEYAELDRQSEKISAKRTKIRTKMEKDHGYPSLAFQEVVRKVKKMTTEERLAHEEMVARGLRVAGVLKQSELWPEMAQKAEKRKAAKADREARAAAKAATKTAADIERGDPKRGGAGGASGRGRAKDVPAKPKTRSTAADRAEAAAERKKNLAETQAASAGASPGQMASPGPDAAAQHAAEQQEGAAILDGKPKAQSVIAAEKRAEAKVP